MPNLLRESRAVDEGDAPVVIIKMPRRSGLPLIAAARDDKTDGAMIALVPRDADQLALDGYELPDELHLTLFFLGDADEITPTQINELVTGLMQLLRAQGRSVPIFAQAFGVAHWNPESEHPAWVLNVGDKARDDPSGLTDLRLQVEDVLRGTGIDYPPQHSPWQPHICIAYSKDDLYGELASKLGPVTFDTLRVAWGEYDIDIPLTTGDVVIAASTSVHDAFHLPGKHNQKSHGNRTGKKDRDLKNSAPTQQKKSTSTKPMTRVEFESRASSAARDEDVFAQLVVNDDMKSVASLVDSGKLPGLSVADVGQAYGEYTGSSYETINTQLRSTNSINDLSDDEAATVKTLDQVMKVSPLTGDIIVQRGIKNPRKTFGDAFVDSNEPDSNRGLTWTDDAFTSTTASSEVADVFGSDVVMNILVPKGTYATAAPGTEFPAEFEIILPRGTKFRVVSSHRSRSIGRMVFNVEVIP